MARSRTRNFIGNTLASIVNQIVVLISGFIVPGIMLHAYGSEINGLSSSISQFITYFSLVEAGLSSASIYALYKPLAKNEHKKINSILSATNKFYIKSGFIFVAISVGMAIVYPMVVDASALSKVEISVLTLILATSGTIDFFTLSKYRALLSADQKQYIITYASSIYTIVYTIIIFVFAKEGTSVIAVRAIALVSVLIRTAILQIYCKTKYKFLDFKEKPNTKALNKRWDALYLQILGTIHTGAPVVIATFLTSLKEVSVYSIYNMVVGGIGGVVGIFSSGLTANFGNVIANDEKATLKVIYDQFEYAYYILITILYSITLVLIVPFVRIYTSGVSDANYIRPFTAFMMCLNGILFCMKTPQGTMVMAAGLFKETRIQTTIQGAIAIIGGIIGAYLMGLDGVLLGAVLSNLYRTIDLIFYSPKYIVHIKPNKSIYRAVRSMLLFLAFVLVANVIKIAPRDYIQWGVYAVPVSVIVSIIVITVNYIFDRKAFNGVVGRVKMLFH